MAPNLVSILTPSLNQARWLRDNLKSVERQTYPNIEQIVMDGGSTDGSLKILEAASRSVHWRSEPDGGQSQALNKAFADSQGEIIGWLNSDDAYYHREAVEMAVQAFHRHPEAAVVYGHAALVNADGLVLQMIWVPRFRPNLLKRHNYIMQPAAFIRRSALTNSNLVDETFDYSMDRELWLRLASRYRFVRVDQVLAVDRHHRDRKSVVRQDLAATDRTLLADKYSLPNRRLALVGVKGWKVAFRLMGLSIARDTDTEPACDCRVDSLARLFTRQALFLRAAMPEGNTISPEAEAIARTQCLDALGVDNRKIRRVQDSPGTKN